ncbi:MAG: SDR family oxidoreductase [Chloroflexi bacterium]|nr:SDR family oxidoreductase [Chloroflexota bacterium]
MRAFVTGSTGLLGTNLVHLLLEQGWEVRALSRTEEKAERILGETAAEIVIGDMEDVAGFADHIAGCDVVFHCAAYFREYYAAGEHWEKLKRINVQGTIEVLRATEAHGVGRVIYTSSGGVLAHPGDGTVLDETADYLPADADNRYFYSKVLAEQAIDTYLETSDLAVIFILPGWMHGPRDSGPTAAGQLVLDYMNGDLPGLINGGQMAVDARDVAQGMINAVECGVSGERYLIAGRPVSFPTLAETLEAVTGQPAPRLTIPMPMALGMAWVSERAAALTGGDTLMTVAGIKTMQRGLTERVSSAKAERVLGVTFRPLSDTLRDAVDWYRANGYL